MPPAAYTEAPALRDERIGKHLAQSQGILAEVPCVPVRKGIYAKPAKRRGPRWPS